MSEQKMSLHIKFHGRILDQLGIQMYQSPVAAISEMVANAWDADADSVKISLPKELSPTATLAIEDDGIGMTFAECESRYLNVGFCRRDGEAGGTSKKRSRPVLGRKGIGKFAGFGIAEKVHVSTISEDTGEETVFELDINKLRGTEYVHSEDNEIPTISYKGPSEARKKKHGTTIVLKNLTLSMCPSSARFTKSMARRFLLHRRAADFKVSVDGQALSDGEGTEKVEFRFPADYKADERPKGLTVDKNGWGEEPLGNGEVASWKFVFYEETIAEEELQGISVFARGKLAQTPFFFNLTGGLGGQHGQAYMSGQVKADYLDGMPEDVISTDRQEVNWEHKRTSPLLLWGQERVKQLLRIWRSRRGETRAKELENKVAEFSSRLDRLGTHEAETVRAALRKLAQVETLSRKQFDDLGGAILTSWEQGRLKQLIEGISKIKDVPEQELLDMLLEAQVLTALNVAEAVKTKLLAVGGLKVRIQKQELETAVRDYIAKNPWLIAPEWETFVVEKSVKNLVKEVAEEADLGGEDWKGRVDLVMSSRNTLLVLEFMRPGLTCPRSLVHIESY